MGMNISKTTNKPTYTKLLPSPDGQYCIVSVQQITLISNENCIPNRIFIDRASPCTFQERERQCRWREVRNANETERIMIKKKRR